MPVTVDIHSDVICPWCWIGKRRLEQALTAFPVGTATVRWHPFQLNPGMPVEGMPRSAYRQQKFGSAEHARALDARTTVVAADEGLAFDLAAQTRTPNTRLAHRLIWWAGRRGGQDALVEALFRAYFSAGMDVGNARTLTQVATGIGNDERGVAAFLAGSEGAAEIAAEEAAIRAQRIDGVPLFIIDGRHRIDGAQPVAVFSALLAQAASGDPHSPGGPEEGSDDAAQG